MVAESKITRIAMWSGPRNISTAMMRAWENRADTAVVDEPFYACFLATSGKTHPMHDEVLASQAQQWDAVINGVLSAPLESGQRVQYQKHMTHHMIADIDLAWFATLKHAFLIRHPAEVMSSYREKREAGTAVDLGYQRQRELYDMASRLNDDDALIIDAKDVLLEPRFMLGKLCDYFELPFDDNMLHWPKGLRQSDGVWASHWYNKVAESSSFVAWKEKRETLTDEQQSVVDECMPHYEYLHKRRLKPDLVAL